MTIAPIFTIPYTHDLNTLREERVKLVRSLLPLVSDPDELLCKLKCRRLVSRHYTTRNLAVDVWFVSRREEGVKRPCHVMSDPIRTLWFHIVLMALVDASTARPCDVQAWKGDYPPGGEREKCTEGNHVCSEDAISFLRALSDVEWELAGLTREALKLATKKDAHMM
jgi:hypothetical protein